MRGRGEKRAIRQARMKRERKNKLPEGERGGGDAGGGGGEGGGRGWKEKR